MFQQHHNLNTRNLVYLWVVVHCHGLFWSSEQWEYLAPMKRRFSSSSTITRAELSICVSPKYNKLYQTGVGNNYCPHPTRLTQLILCVILACLALFCG